MRLRYIFSGLTETRLAMVELVKNFHDLRYLLSVALVPQMIVMVVILYQICMMKRKEKKIKKQLERTTRNQMLLTRLTDFRRSRRE